MLPENSDNSSKSNNNQADSKKESEIDQLLHDVVTKVIDTIEFAQPPAKNRPRLRLVGPRESAPGAAPSNSANPTPTTQALPIQRPPSYFDLKQKWSEIFEKEYLITLLNKYNGNVTAASHLARVERSNFLRLLRKHGLKSNTYRKAA